MNQRKVMLSSIDKALEGYDDSPPANTPAAGGENDSGGDTGGVKGADISTPDDKAGQVDENKASSESKKQEARDDKGRFAKKDEPKPADKPADKTPPKDLTQKAPAAEDAPKAAVQAPASWTQNAKADFASLPPNVQAEVARLEAERVKAVRTAQEESANFRKRYGELEPVLQLHRQRLMTTRGETEAQGVRRLLEIEAVFDRDPVSVLKELARQRGINLATLTQDAGGNQQPDPSNPAFDELKKLKSMVLQDRQARQQAEQSARAASFEQFEKSVDDKGAAKYPHLQALMDETVYNPLTRQETPLFAYHVLQVRLASPSMPDAQVLDQAYTNAVYTNPTIREQVLQAERDRLAQASAAQAQAEADKAKAKAQQAKNAAVSVRGSSAAPIPQKSGNGKPDIKALVGRRLEALNI